MSAKVTTDFLSVTVIAQNETMTHSQSGRCTDAAAGLWVPAELPHTAVHDVDVLEESYC